MNGKRHGRPWIFLATIVSLSGAGWVNAQSALPEGGTLTIQFGETDQIYWDAPEPTDDVTVAIDNLRDLGLPGTNPAQSDCVLALDGANSTLSEILSINGNGKTPGFNDQKDQVGIREQKKGVDCGRVVGGQSLTLELGPTLTGSQLKAVLSSFGFTVKKNVVIDIKLFSDAGDTAPSASFELRSGTSVVEFVGNPPASAEDPALWNTDGDNALIYNCNPSSDSGSDNDAACGLTNLPGVWEKVTLSARQGSNGEFALGAGASTFELAGITDELFCGETTIEAFDLQSGAFGKLRRLDNEPDKASNCTESCRSIPYYLAWGNGELLFLADYVAGDDNQSCATFAFTVEFPAEDIQPLRPLDNDLTPDPEPPAEDPYVGDDERAVECLTENCLTDGNFARTVTAQIPLRIGQQFLADDPDFYLDTCLGTPIFATADDPNVEPAYLKGDLVDLDFGGTAPPDMSDLPGIQYGCWYNLRLLYGSDPDPDDADGTGVADKVFKQVDGFLRGDWVIRKY